MFALVGNNPSAEDFRECVGVLATIVTILQFLSGCLICVKYMKTRTTGETSGLSFVCGFFSCNLWLKYGLLKDDPLLFFVNAVGCVLFLSYIVTYYKFTAKKSSITLQFFGVCSLLLLFHIYILYEKDRLNAINTTGLISCLVTLIFIASPLTLLFHVIKVKNTESLPFPIILTTFFVCTLWYIYGYLSGDEFMELPNAIGAILSLFQLSLFLYFPSVSSTLQVPYTKFRQNV